jgi:hypothetical protein
VRTHIGIRLVWKTLLGSIGSAVLFVAKSVVYVALINGAFSYSGVDGCCVLLLLAAHVPAQESSPPKGKETTGLAILRCSETERCKRSNTSH